MSEQKDFRSDLDMWMDMWDSAQDENVHPPVPAAKPTSFDRPAHEVDDWSYQFAMGGQGGSDEPNHYDIVDGVDELFQEDASSENPIHPDSAGPDSEKPEPVWVKEDIAKEIVELKAKLYDMECKMAQLGGGEKWNEKPVEVQSGGMSKIDALRKKIEKSSNKVGIDESRKFSKKTGK